MKDKIKEFEDIMNKAKLKGYSKLSLKQPLSKECLRDYKETFCKQYGYSKEELEIALKGK